MPPQRLRLPRLISRFPIDDELVRSLSPTAARSKTCPAGHKTCWAGYTFVCECHGQGQTCLSTHTFKCDTGTCTGGITWWCDDPPALG